MRLNQRSAVGTRAYGELRPGDWRVVCATCDAGGTISYKTRSEAGQAATTNSARPCQSCGAR